MNISSALKILMNSKFWLRLQAGPSERVNRFAPQSTGRKLAAQSTGKFAPQSIGKFNTSNTGKVGSSTSRPDASARTPRGGKLGGGQSAGTLKLQTLVKLAYELTTIDATQTNWLLFLWKKIKGLAVPKLSLSAAGASMKITSWRKHQNRHPKTVKF